MNKGPRIRNTILLYFYATLLVAFVVLVISFAMASRSRVESILKERLDSAETIISEFQDTKGSDASGRRYALNNMMRSGEGENGVNLLFLDSNRELTLKLQDQSEVGGMGSGMGMMRGRSDTQEPQDTGLSMLLNHQAYLESEAVYNYVKSTDYDLSSPAIHTAQINGEGYYLQSTPFTSEAAGGGEYVLTFVGRAEYDTFLNNALRILAIVMGSILILTFFVVRYLANRLARPISQLQGLSARLGSGDFRGEDLDLHERELQELNESLNETAEKLKTYDENQKRFFQNISHELRTPLTNIKGYAEGIHYGVFDGKDASQVILSESERLGKLVDDILYLSRIESGAVSSRQRATMRLSEILYEARELVRADASLNHKEIHVSLTQDPLVSVYPSELSRALVNLLSNAIRYARENIWLEGTVGNGELLITVSDDGKGIEPGQEENIFQRFSKGTDGKHGIGLSIVRASAELHGGKVWAGGRKDGPGAQFNLSLPLKAEDSD